MGDPLWSGQVFKGRIDCDKWTREGWGPVVLTVEVTGVRSRENFVCLTHIDEPSGNVRPAEIWMEADGTFDATKGEISIMESSVHANSPDGVEVTPFAWSGVLEGIRMKGGFKVVSNAAEYGRTVLNLLCISGGAKTHVLSGNVAMEEVRNRIGGLHKALEAESWERRKTAKSESRRVAMGLASRRAETTLKQRAWENANSMQGARDSMMAAESAAGSRISSARQASVMSIILASLRVFLVMHKEVFAGERTTTTTAAGPEFHEWFSLGLAEGRLAAFILIR